MQKTCSFFLHTPIFIPFFSCPSNPLSHLNFLQQNKKKKKILFLSSFRIPILLLRFFINSKSIIEKKNSYFFFSFWDQAPFIFSLHSSWAILLVFQLSTDSWKSKNGFWKVTFFDLDMCSCFCFKNWIFEFIQTAHELYGHN